MSKTPPPGAIDYEEACALLGLPCAADPNQIDDDQLKKAFRKAALKAHPDKGGSDDEFRKVKAASECIVRAKKHGLAHAADANYDSDSEENNFEAFFDEEGDDIMAEIILRMFVAARKSISRRTSTPSLVGFHIGTRWKRGEVPLEVSGGRSAI
jgi:curved DNA-binding protein CbpA